MKAYLLSAALLGAAMTLSASPVLAGPVCLTTNGPYGNVNCDFGSFRACRSAQRHVGGSCATNLEKTASSDVIYGYSGGPGGFGSAANRYEIPIYRDGTGGIFR